MLQTWRALYITLYLVDSNTTYNLLQLQTKRVSLVSFFLSFPIINISSSLQTISFKYISHLYTISSCSGSCNRQIVFLAFTLAHTFIYFLYSRIFWEVNQIMALPPQLQSCRSFWLQTPCRDSISWLLPVWLHLFLLPFFGLLHSITWVIQAVSSLMIFVLAGFFFSIP